MPGPDGPPPRRLLLVGGGHAHLEVLRAAGRLRAAGLHPILACPPALPYSGMATGVLSGALQPGANVVDVAAIAAAHGVPHVPAEVLRLDRAARLAVLADGRTLAFDVASLNIGSLCAGPDGLLGRPGTWAVKPLAGLAGLRARILAWLGETGRAPRIVVAGGGATAHEAAAALAGLLRRHGAAPAVTLAGPEPAGWAPPAALRRLRAGLAARGVVLREGRVAARPPGACLLADGTALPCDLLLLATGLRAPPLAAESGLPVDGLGRLRVTAALHAVDGTDILAAGDCAAVEGAPRPMLGVFGVRAAPVLAANLLALAGGGRLRAFRPPRRWLSILDLGDGTGLAIRGGLWWQGRAALWAKRALDGAFLRRHGGATHAA